jgi:hypothetical protein
LVEPRPSVFGIDTDVYDSSHANYVRDIPSARKLGARWDHFTLGAATGAGGFGTIDYQVTQARRYGLGVVLSFGGISSACSMSPRPADIHACPPRTVLDLSRYEAYVRRVVLRYRNAVDYYESWTEPNNKSSWLPGPQPALYAAVLSAQHHALQAVNRRYGLHVKLLFGSPTDFSVTPRTNGWMATLRFTNAVLAALHGRKPFDGIALHAYRFPPGPYGPAVPAYDYVGGLALSPGSGGPFPDQGCSTSPWCQMTWPQELSSYETLFADYGYGQQSMWLTEFGWPGNASRNGDYFPSYSDQAQELHQAYDDLLALPFVKGAMWFNVRDYQPRYSSPDPAFFYHYGLLNYNFSRKTAAKEFTALAHANPGR